MASGSHLVGSLTFLLSINVLFQIVCSIPIGVGKRNIGVSGAPDSTSVDNEDIQLYASLGLQEISKFFEGSNEPALVEIECATSQTVAGTLNVLRIRVGTSNCAKGEKENCQLLDGSETKLYKIKAWSRPWLAGEDGLKIDVETIEEATEECNSGTKITRNKRSSLLLGGARPISIDDEYVKNYTSLGMQKVSENYGGPNEPMLIEIVSATKQTVAGSKYKMRINVGSSDCLKGTQENCKLLENSEPQVYEITAWSRPWLSGAEGLQIDVVRIPKETSANA